MPNTDTYTPGTCTRCKCQINLEVEGPECDECVNTEIGEAQEELDAMAGCSPYEGCECLSCQDEVKAVHEGEREAERAVERWYENGRRP